MKDVRNVPTSFRRSVDGLDFELKLNEPQKTEHVRIDFEEHQVQEVTRHLVRIGYVERLLIQIQISLERLPTFDPDHHAFFVGNLGFTHRKGLILSREEHHPLGESFQFVVGKDVNQSHQCSKHIFGMKDGFYRKFARVRPFELGMDHRQTLGTKGVAAMEASQQTSGIDVLSIRKQEGSPIATRTADLERQVVLDPATTVSLPGGKRRIAFNRFHLWIPIPTEIQKTRMDNLLFSDRYVKNF